MYDYRKLEGRIVEKYGTRKALAEKIGMPEATFSGKLNGRFEFRPTEITKILEALEIPKEKVGEYFFSLKS